MAIRDTFTIFIYLKDYTKEKTTKHSQEVIGNARSTKKKN